MADNRSGALVPSVDRPSFEPGDLAPLENDVAGEVELDADLARGDRELARLGFSPDEIARARGRQPGHAVAASSAPTREAVEKELAELAELRKTNKSKYYSAPVQDRERRLLELREALSASQQSKTVEIEGDGSGLPQSVIGQWDKGGRFAQHLAYAQGTAQAVFSGLGEDDGRALFDSFERLPEAAKAAIYEGIGYAAHTGWRPATKDQVALFSETAEGAALASAWGPDAAKHVGVIRGRWGALMAALSPEHQKAVGAWIDTLPSATVAALWQTVATR